MGFLTKSFGSAIAFILCGGPVPAVQVPAKPAVRVEFRRAESQPAKGLTEATVAGTTRKVYLHREPAVTNKDIANAQVTPGDRGRATVRLTFTEKGKEKLAELTGGHLNKPVAVLVDGKVIAAPVVRAKISGGEAALFVGTRAEAERIVKCIKGK